MYTVLNEKNASLNLNGDTQQYCYIVINKKNIDSVQMENPKISSRNMRVNSQLRSRDGTRTMSKMNTDILKCPVVLKHQNFFKLHFVVYRWH